MITRQALDDALNAVPRWQQAPKVPIPLERLQVLFKRLLKDHQHYNDLAFRFEHISNGDRVAECSVGIDLLKWYMTQIPTVVHQPDYRFKRAQYRNELAALRLSLSALNANVRNFSVSGVRTRKRTR